MTSKKNRVLLLYHVKVFPSFCSHLLIHTGVITWKCSIWVKIINFASHVNLKFDGWPRETIKHLFYATASIVNHFVAICGFKLELQFGNTQIGGKFGLTSVTFTFDLWPRPFAWTSFLSMTITFENFMMIWSWEEHCAKGDRQTDGQTDGQNCS